jgi:hypothetical protein
MNCHAHDTYIPARSYLATTSIHIFHIRLYRLCTLAFGAWAVAAERVLFRFWDLGVSGPRGRGARGTGHGVSTPAQPHRPRHATAPGRPPRSRLKAHTNNDGWKDEMHDAMRSDEMPARALALTSSEAVSGRERPGAWSRYPIIGCNSIYHSENRGCKRKLRFEAFVLWHIRT